MEVPIGQTNKSKPVAGAIGTLQMENMEVPIGQTRDSRKPPESPQTLDAKARIQAALLAGEARQAERREREQHRIATGVKGPTRYTTDCAIAWGKARGWKLIDRERFDYRTKRHCDTMLGSDAMLESPKGLVLVQGAGKSERAEHWRRFEKRGGAAACKRRQVRFFYLEFVRGNKVPILIERWDEIEGADD